jgi:excisionase family DNA binding protein
MKPTLDQSATFPPPVHAAPPTTIPSALNEGPLLDRHGVAALLGISPRTVDQLMRDRKLPFCRITRKLVRFNRADVLAHLRERFAVTAKGGPR